MKRTEEKIEKKKDEETHASIDAYIIEDEETTNDVAEHCEGKPDEFEYTGEIEGEKKENKESSFETYPQKAHSKTVAAERQTLKRRAEKLREKNSKIIDEIDIEIGDVDMDGSENCDGEEENSSRSVSSVDSVDLFNLIDLKNIQYCHHADDDDDSNSNANINDNGIGNSDTFEEDREEEEGRENDESVDMNNVGSPRQQRPQPRLQPLPLPHAYPINFPIQNDDGIYAVDGENIHNNNPINENGNHHCTTKEGRKIAIMVTFVVSTIIILNGLLASKLIESGFTETTDNMKESEDASHNDDKNQNDSITNLKNNETEKIQNLLNNDTLSNNNNGNLEEEEKEEDGGNKVFALQLCYSDPLAIQLILLDLYNEGNNAKRTFIFCPNTNIYPYELDSLVSSQHDLLGTKYDFSSGSHFPLTIFIPNLHFKCGYNADINNNCTFHGGFNQINIQRKIDIVEQPLENTSAENIVIEGFRFTGTSGSSISVRNITGSLTLRNCHFYNNSGSYASVELGAESNFDLYVENCVFENNTYMYPEKIMEEESIFNTSVDKDIVDTSVEEIDRMNDMIERRARRSKRIGAILSTSEKPQRIHVFKSKFLNNRFFNQYEKEEAAVVVTEQNATRKSSVINIFPPSMKLAAYEYEWQHSMTILESCFVGNVGYSSAVILGIDKENGGNNNTDIEQHRKPLHEKEYTNKTDGYEITDNLFMFNYPSSLSSQLDTSLMTTNTTTNTVETYNDQSNCLFELQYFSKNNAGVNHIESRCVMDISTPTSQDNDHFYHNKSMIGGRICHRLT